MKQLAEMNNSERRKLLKTLSDCEYENVIRALGSMPLIDFSIQCEGNHFSTIKYYSQLQIKIMAK